jgi:ribosomal protein S18 acetylase RimI-like enzyme
MAAYRLPPSKAGFQFTLHESIPASPAWLTQNKLTPYYETFDMRHRNLERANGGFAAEIEPIRLQPSSELHELYSVLCQSFKDNLDTSIPSLEKWIANRASDPSTLTWVFRDEGKILGFINLGLVTTETNKAECGEIRTLGVLPGVRRRGVGRALLSFALNQLVERRCTQCTLSVATKNERALELYRSLGFEVVDHYRVFARNRETSEHQPMGQARPIQA